MKASDLFVKALEAEGVEYVFGIPGEENLDLLESLRNSSIRLVLTRHEQAAGFMAATYGRLTGKAGVCMSTLGPGATNLVTAAAYAQLGAMPMVMITGQKPVKSSKQGQFQIIDVVDMMRPITKFTHQIVSGEAIPTRVREAFRRAEEERPGATHLELPEDIADEETAAPLTPASQSRRPIAEDKSIRIAAEAIARARRPLLLIGAGANRKLTSKMLSQFVDEVGIPFMTTQMGKGVVDETHELFLGNAALSDNDFLHRAIVKADLIINVGHDVVEKPPFFMVDDRLKVIHVNFSSAVVDPVYFPQIEVVGDIANSIWRIKERLVTQGHWDFDHFRTVQQRLSAHILEGSDDDGFPVRPQRLVADVRRVIPDDGIVALDNGVYKIWFARNYRARLPNTVLLDNALATHGSRPAERHGRAPGLSGPPCHRHLRRRRLHDEFPGARNRRAARHEPGGGDSARRRLRHDQVEAGESGFRRVGSGLRQSRLREVCRVLRRHRAPGGGGRGVRATARALPPGRGRAPDRPAGGLLRQRPDPEPRDQGAERVALIRAEP